MSPRQTADKYIESLNEKIFFDSYRTSKECFGRIFQCLCYQKKSNGEQIDPKIEFLSLLSYLSTGSFMLVSERQLNISKSSAFDLSTAQWRSLAQYHLVGFAFQKILICLNLASMINIIFQK